MNKTMGTTLALVSALALGLSACAANEGGTTTTGSGTTLTGTLSGKGSSAQSAAQKQWISDFQTKNTGVTINYSPDGSGAGRDGFASGAVSFGASDRPYSDSEMGAGKFGKCASDSNALNLPVYISPIAIVFNVQGLEKLNLDAETAAAIFNGTITTWNDPKIAALNPGATLPAANITAVHRSDDSGTTDNFTDWLNVNAPTVWTNAHKGTWPAEYAGEAAKGTAGVVDTVTKGTNTIGYVDESAAGSLKKAAIKVGGEFVTPSAAGAAAMVDKSSQIAGRATNDLAFKLDRTAAGTYPLAMVSYALVCQHYKDAKEAALVKAYIGYVASADGQASAAKSAGAAPLSTALQAKVKAAIDSVQ